MEGNSIMKQPAMHSESKYIPTQHFSNITFSYFDKFDFCTQTVFPTTIVIIMIIVQEIYANLFCKHRRKNNGKHRMVSGGYYQDITEILLSHTCHNLGNNSVIT